jgi:RNA polymerase sigma-70 factor (ECF subfamily)
MSSSKTATIADEDLVVRVAEGDPVAYRELVRRHAAPLRHYSQRLVKNASEAEDVVQETFLRLWQRASDYKPQAARAKTWLYRIAHNLCIDRLRARKPLADLDSEELAPVSAAQGSLLDEKRRAERLEQAIAGLPERQAAAVALVHFEGLSGAEAAQVLDVSEGALESLLSRARRALKASVLALSAERESS